MEREDAQQERTNQHLHQGQLLAAPEEGTAARLRRENRLDFLLDGGDKGLAGIGALVLARGTQGGDEMRLDLGEEGVDEEGDPGTLECAFGGVGGGEEVRGMGVGEELGDDGGFGHDFAVVGYAGDKAALWGEGVLELCMLGGLGGGIQVHTGLISRYHGSRGVSRSMMTSS